MPDQILGYVLIGAAVLAIAAIVASAARGREQPPLLPALVHVPPAVAAGDLGRGGGLLWAGSLKPDDQPLRGVPIPGLGVFVVGPPVGCTRPGWRRPTRFSRRGLGHH